MSELFAVNLWTIKICPAKLTFSYGVYSSIDVETSWPLLRTMLGRELNHNLESRHTSREELSMVA